jgi:RNA polymerase sigma factor (TIGR02999 family)
LETAKYGYTIASDLNEILENMSEATVLLNALDDGGPQAAEKLLELLYDELRRLANSKMANEAAGHTLQPTALVHEAWLRLVGNKNQKFANRAHFFSAAAEAMRRILIDRARHKLTSRQGGEFKRIELDEQVLAVPYADEQLLAVHEVLDNLARDYPVQAEVVKLRYFVGMTNEETAQALGVSVATVKIYWTFARTWIFNEIKQS